MAHEEKESDVNLAIHLLHEAYCNSYDVALLLTADSDLAPAVRLVCSTFPEKRIRILAPPNRPHSKELVASAGGPKRCSKIKRVHLERALLPETLRDVGGKILARRPSKYAPET
jgi:hypothetical protein